MTTIISDFKIFKSHFPKLLELSGYRMDYLAERIGLSASVFSNKKKRNSFELEEMEKLMSIVWNDYLEEKFLEQAIKEGKEEGHLSKEETKKLFSEWK
jgi:ribonucleotide reductase alpha subunit